MKYVLFSLFLLISSVAASQSIFGITGGIQLAGLHGPEGYTTFSDPRIGFRVGGAYEHNIGNLFGIHTEVSYSLTGGKNENHKIGISYISVPVLFYFKPLKKIKLNLGPEMNIFLGHHSKLTGANFEYKRFDFGISAGGEFMVTEKLGVSIRNYFGLTYASEYDTGKYTYIQPDDPIINSNREIIKYNRSNVFQLSVNYYFVK